MHHLAQGTDWRGLKLVVTSLRGRQRDSSHANARKAYPNPTFSRLRYDSSYGDSSCPTSAAYDSSVPPSAGYDSVPPSAGYDSAGSAPHSAGYDTTRSNNSAGERVSAYSATDYEVQQMVNGQPISTVPQSACRFFERAGVSCSLPPPPP